MNYSVELIVVLSLPILLFFYVKCTSRTKARSMEREAPEVSGAWPIIGHLHLLGRGDELFHHKLGSLADKYGPAFNIRLGMHRAFVVSSWEVAKECFTVNDLALASRPVTAAVKHMCYDNKVFGLGPYNPFCREMKKIATHELLSNNRIEKLRYVRLSEINSGLNELYGRCAESTDKQVVVQLSDWLENIMFNIIGRMVAGKRYFGVGSHIGEIEAPRFRKAIFEFFRLSGAFVLSDVIPFLCWLDLHQHKKQMKKTAKDLDLVLGGWVNEHRQKRKERNRDDDDKDFDFIDVMLSLEDEGKLPNTKDDPDSVIKATCLSMILGGNTTAATVNWAISLVLKHPDVMKKLQDEIEDHVGKDRQVDESDIKNLAFLEAVTKETLRLYPAGPLLAPREAKEDCTVAGFDVKAGTRLIVNVWKLQRDESVWKNPSEFQPERFLDFEHKHIDLKGHQFVLMPFGSGRRSCPASTLALLQIHLTLARLLHSFNLVQPRGDLPLDMTEGPGMTNPKKKPLHVLVTPRLPSWIYDN